MLQRQKKEKIEVERPKQDPQEEMKTPIRERIHVPHLKMVTFFRQQNEGVCVVIKLFTRLQIPQSSLSKIVLRYHFQVPPVAFIKNRTKQPMQM